MTGSSSRKNAAKKSRLAFPRQPRHFQVYPRDLAAGAKFKRGDNPHCPTSPSSPATNCGSEMSACTSIHDRRVECLLPQRQENAWCSFLAAFVMCEYGDTLSVVQPETTQIVTFIIRSPETSEGIFTSGEEGAPHNAKEAETDSEPLTLRS